MRDEQDWFLTLAELEHMTDAAAQLHLTQPTLTRMLQRLERRVGVALFDRVGKRITLNAYGRIYYDRLRRAQAELDAAAREIAELADPDHGSVRLSFLHSFGVRLVPQLIGGFRAAAPGVRFELSQDAAEVLVGKITSRDADLAIVAPRPVLARLAWRPLLRQQLALAVPVDHRFAARAAVDLAEAADEPFISMHAEFGMRRIFEQLCAAAQFRPRISFESGELGTVAGLVAAGLGVAVLPVEQDPLLPPGLIQVPLTAADASREIGIVWATDRAMPQPVRAFLDYATAWATDRSPRSSSDI